MEKKRIFRQDFIPLDKEYQFKSGDVATIVKEEIPNVTFKIKDQSYFLPYRDFIIITKKIEVQ